MSSAARAKAATPEIPPGIGTKLAVSASGFVLLLTLGLTWLAWDRFGVHDAQVLRADFGFRARDVERRIAQRMSAYEQVLHGAAGLFAASREVTRVDFRDYVASLQLQDHYPGIQGVGFALLVPTADVARHTSAVQREGFPAYAIRPPGPRDPYTSIVFLEPFEGRNLRAFGYDMFSEPVRRAAMERALAEGIPVLSGKVVLVQETDAEVQAGVLLYLPVFRNGTTGPSVTERRERLLGWVYIPFRMNDLVVGVLGERGPELATRIYDGDVPTSAGLLFDSENAKDSRTSALGHLEVRQTFLAAGRPWTIVVNSLPAFHARLANDTGQVVAFGGVALSILLAGLTWLLVRGRDRAVQIARGMNQGLLEANEALEESETRLHLALRGGDLGTWDWDIPSGRVAYNDRWAEMLGYSLGEIEPNVSSWERLLHPDDRLRNQPALDAALRGDTASWSWEQRLLHKDGHWVWVLGSGAVVARSPDGSALRAAGTHLDITDRKLAEEQRLVQEKRLDLAAEFGGLGLWDLDLTTNLAWRTLQHDRLFGYDEMQPSWGAEDALRHVVPEDRPIFQHALEEALTTGDFHYELRIDPKNHPRRWIQADGRVSRDDAGRPVRMAGIVLDITKRKLAEEAMGSLQAQLALTSRLAALGTLVAGVAHEINNPLAAALSDQELARGAVGELRERLRGGGPLDREAEVHHLDEVVEELDEAQDAGRRIARIVKDLRTFGRPNQTRTRTPLGDIVDLALRWVPVTAAHTATVTVENEGAPDVMASPGQIEQVVANLVTNAVNATQEGMRGAIVVRIGPGKPGMARLDVIDHGKGIDPAVMARIFEPFFTTRDVGKGMGLGLSICHAIVTNHGGTLTATSEAGKGSTFRVELPAATAEA
jgi:PAS domain S-box-containing protein